MDNLNTNSTQEGKDLPDTKNGGNEAPTKECKHCRMQIPLKATVCPYCHKKQKRSILPIILGAVVVLIIIIALASAGNKNSSQHSEGNLSSSTTNEATTPTTAQMPTAKPTPTPVPGNLMTYFYSYLGEGEGIPYRLNDKATAFMLAHEDQFPAMTDDVVIDESLIDTAFDYREMLKNPAKFGDKLISMPQLYIAQIFENELGDDDYLTSLNLVDENSQHYYVYYIGDSLTNILQGDVVSLIGLPLGTSYYDNVSGGQTNVIVIAGTKVTRVG